MSRKVDFIVIGVQKAGTTALFEYLSEDPAFNLARVKETHFFDDEGVDWAAPDYGAYHALFDDRPGLRGEATPIYAYWPCSLERIAAYNPQIRLILMLRDPVERAFSHWKMEYARCAEKMPFSWCIRDGRRRLFDADPWGFHREFSYVERGFYGEQVERLLGLFSAQQVLVLRSDDLLRDPGAQLNRLNGFLGAPPPPAVRPRAVHVAHEMDYPSRLTQEDRDFLRALYVRDAARLADLTGVRFQ